MSSASRTDEPMLISVVMGAYNAEPYIAEAIESVLAQTYRPLELVVVDDGSTDGTGEIVRSYGEPVFYHRQENRGDAAARNEAIRLSRGGVLVFLDADDRCPPNRVELQWAALEADPELDAVFGHIREFVSPELSPEQAASFRTPFSEPTPWPGVMPMAIRREAFERVGPFSETLRLGSPVDWTARALDLGLRTLMLPQLVVERRLHPTSLSLRESASRPDYLDVVKIAMQRRRAAAAEQKPEA